MIKVLHACMYFHAYYIYVYHIYMKFCGRGCLSFALSVRGVEVVGYPPTWHKFHVADDILAYGLSRWLVFRASLCGNSLWSSVGTVLLNCRTWQPSL